MRHVTPQELLAKRHATIFYLLLFSIGVLIAGLATVPAFSSEALQSVYSATMSSIAAALMVATVLFAIRFWFMIGSNELFLRRTATVEGSQGTGLIRVFDRMEDFGLETDWVNLIAKSKEHVDIMGRTSYGWCNYPDLASLIETRIRKQQVRFRWLIMGPGNPFLPTLKEKDINIGDMLQRKILATTNTLLKIRKSLPEHLKDYLEIRHFNDTPLYFSLTRIDYKLYITHYQSSKDSKSCPMSQVYGIDSTWGESHLSEFELLWKNSRSVPEDSTQLTGPELQFDQRMLKELQDQHHVYSRRVIEENRADFHDFNQGWRILFNELLSKHPGITSPRPNEELKASPILRDFTASGHGVLGCQCWNLQRYPQMIRFHLQEALEHDYEARFLIVCQSMGIKNASAEYFLHDLLDIVYRPKNHPRCSFPELFAEWRTCFEAENLRLKIRLSCPDIAVKASDNRVFLRHPFNVYGSSCVSRSILTFPHDPTSPAPHLEVLWNQEVVLDHQRIFDAIWDASLDHQNAIFSTDESELTKLGEGILFDKWSVEQVARL